MQLENIKSKIFNILIIGLALIIANNIYKSQSGRILALKQQKEVELKKQVVLGDIKRSYSRIAAIKAFINKKEISTVVNSLADIAKECYIQIDSLKPLKEEQFSEYSIYPFELSVSADNFHTLGKFISKLESSSDFYIVRKLDFHLTGRFGAGQNKLTANLVIATVLIKD
ncbi:MAG: type 4a pilus biogenesis protein PilO [Candidatus Omnitrophota bacterium]